MCQRPKRASFISTKEEGMTFEELEKGVNALNGLLSFLQGGRKMSTLVTVYVSTP